MKTPDLNEVKIQAGFSLEDINIEGFSPMPSPAEIKRLAPLTEAAAETVNRSRTDIKKILDNIDDRLLVITGPCSIHDPKAALEYAERLLKLSEHVSETILPVMRVYFEKPRTVTGWKGFINDPHMDNSFKMAEGMLRARELMIKINEMGLPVATEALDPFGPQYLGELVSWYAIGARTTESQTHREMASGLSAPVGFKNGTDGQLDSSINAVKASRQGHFFLGIYEDGRSSIVRTKGNRYSHLVLRGGGGRPNFDTVSVMLAEEALKKAGVASRLIIDCSHANSMKNPDLQPFVLRDVITQVINGSRAICGVMLESNLFAGNQKIPDDLSQLKYGVSVTDACIDWEATEHALRTMHRRLLDKKLNG
ncbi:3-deoxy-7-phosphoheptulonate synthase [Parasutterella muris]|uniref:3-deoxy-7-phosphoheptulonate synthase n=1 Tax=Parasutterella muris TaxID=2565572 RepID=UPI00203B8869|nr:3-deoxy-7-phosphoheptulonate synthase [Parasutterella muris]